MKIPDDIIADFFAGKCSKEQEEEVLSYFENNREALNNYLQPDDLPAGQSGGSLIDSATSGKLLARIHSRLQKSAARKRALKGGILSFLILAGIAGWLVFSLKKQNTGIDSAAVVNIEPQTMQQANSSGKPEQLQLPDHTAIILYNNSCITYINNSGLKERQVFIEGEADFKVAGDTARPFVVWAGNIATKALGTRFKIKAEKEKVTVRLYEGKVVVWNKDQVNPPQYFLTPNRQIVFKTNQNRFTVSLLQPAKQESSRPRQPEKQQAALKGTISFKNVPLKEAFDKIADVFDVRITYTAKDLEAIHIIADYSRQESVEKLLQNIAQINNLKLVKISDKDYQVSRK
ncbi:hypothetical protein A8C56_18645 [Niabella ginsenosidivorans]|uniref:FecR protein domain-containing protein n=1 Tax=Niabella ginsenosidivorans TaxID=1176587 RepID=A0A1A9I866_9BACT|nr:FecR domain-containing protein [Niabella ginsenosidivorans]ANH82724.1 hypothetical protein A8C56_18645 [Niabella ginsenosidivorans]